MTSADQVAPDRRRSLTEGEAHDLGLAHRGALGEQPLIRGEAAERFAALLDG